MNHLVLHDGRTVWPGDRLVLEDEDEIERTVTEVGVDLVRYSYTFNGAERRGVLLGSNPLWRDLDIVRGAHHGLLDGRTRVQKPGPWSMILPSGFRVTEGDQLQTDRVVYTVAELDPGRRKPVRITWPGNSESTWLAAADSWLLRTLKEAGVEKQATQPQQKEQKTENNTMSDFSRGISETILASKVNTYEAAATALTTSANKAMVAEIATLVEDVSPEFASFLRTELGRPAALYLAAVVLHGASTTGALPFAPEALQSYAERTQFGAVYEASSLLTDGLLEKMKTTVFGHLMDWGSKMEALAQRAEVSA